MNHPGINELPVKVRILKKSGEINYLFLNACVSTYIQANVHTHNGNYTYEASTDISDA